MSRDLESRVQELEDIMAIENLKHTYLNACDAKDVELMKSTFKADHCDIDYGPVGKFNHREDLVKLLMTQLLIQELKELTNIKITS